MDRHDHIEARPQTGSDSRPDNLHGQTSKGQELADVQNLNRAARNGQASNSSLPDLQITGMDAGATDGGALKAGATDGGALKAGATDGGALKGGATDGGPLKGGATDGRRMFVVQPNSDNMPASHSAGTNSDNMPVPPKSGPEKWHQFK